MKIQCSEFHSLWYKSNWALEIQGRNNLNTRSSLGLGLVNGAATRFNGLLNGSGTGRVVAIRRRTGRTDDPSLPANSHLSASCPSIIVAGNPTTIWWRRQEFTDRRRRSSIDRRGPPEEFSDTRSICSLSVSVNAHRRCGRNAIINRCYEYDRCQRWRRSSFVWGRKLRTTAQVRSSTPLDVIAF